MAGDSQLDEENITNLGGAMAAPATNNPIAATTEDARYPLIQPSPPYPAHPDAPWVNGSIPFATGPFAGKSARISLTVEQHPIRGRKGAQQDLRPLQPPPVIRMRIFSGGNSRPAPSTHEAEGTPNAVETPVPATAALTPYFICLATLYKVHPPTREIEAGRVESKHRASAGANGPSPRNASSASAAASPDAVDKPTRERLPELRSLRAHPLITISSRDPAWPAALKEANEKAAAHSWSPPRASTRAPATTTLSPGIESQARVVSGDVSPKELARLEPYLPLEKPKFVVPYLDLSSRLSRREASVHLVGAKEDDCPAFYFVFPDLAIKQEGYYCLRFHVLHLQWQVDGRLVATQGMFPPLADCFSNVFAVYSTKEFPGLPPTTDMTNHLIRQGIRIRQREEREGSATARRRSSKQEEDSEFHSSEHDVKPPLSALSSLGSLPTPGVMEFAPTQLWDTSVPSLSALWSSPRHNTEQDQMLAAMGTSPTTSQPALGFARALSNSPSLSPASDSAQRPRLRTASSGSLVARPHPYRPESVQSTRRSRSRGSLLSLTDPMLDASSGQAVPNLLSVAPSQHYGSLVQADARQDSYIITGTPALYTHGQIPVQLRHPLMHQLHQDQNPTTSTEYYEPRFGEVVYDLDDKGNC